MKNNHAKKEVSILNQGIEKKQARKAIKLRTDFEN
jgi:hypothetical protein